MRVGISVMNFSWPDGPGALRSNLPWLVREADRIGLDTVWVARCRLVERRQNVASGLIACRQAIPTTTGDSVAAAPTPPGAAAKPPAMRRRQVAPRAA